MSKTCSARPYAIVATALALFLTAVTLSATPIHSETQPANRNTIHLPTLLNNYASRPTFLQIDGEGEAVTDNYLLPPCHKAVFYWRVMPSTYGSASLILRLYQVGSSQAQTLVNQFESDVPATGLTGAALYHLSEGQYYFSADNTSESWFLWVECQDNLPPIAEGMVITARGNTVTDNYQLATCNKSVFRWQVTPNSYGTAALIIHLHKAGDDRFTYLVNALEFDQTDPIGGEALEPVQTGMYYLVTENSTGAWSVEWECRD